MPVLHMETELAHQTGRQLTQASEEVASAAWRVSSACGALAAAWEGPSRDVFSADIDGAIRTLRALAEQGQELGLRLQREAQQWEEVDHNGAFAFCGLGTPFG